MNKTKLTTRGKDVKKNKQTKTKSYLIAVEGKRLCYSCVMSLLTPFFFKHLLTFFSLSHTDFTHLQNDLAISHLIFMSSYRLVAVQLSHLN